MTAEEWTYRSGIQDIVAYLRRRALWGALVWALVLGLIHGVGELNRTAFGLAFLGGVACGVALTWRMTERHQWAGVVPHALATVGILTLLVPMTFLSHWLWPLDSARTLRSVLALNALGVLLRDIGWTLWAAPYHRRR